MPILSLSITQRYIIYSDSERSTYTELGGYIRADDGGPHKKNGFKKAWGVMDISLASGTFDFSLHASVLLSFPVLLAFPVSLFPFLSLAL